ncbi:hypothetical protein DFQ05_2182 [Winogradskyella wandonensis]|uniref:Uncharacterized protein n=1 Tax=Winogradskyella wandonensis TaxID=1442586 RepID=A0A4R1KPD8_9FLAO|nr:hypothetical protein [Winogradskyella wandonensis]TCK66896.1 hypothetical protein DFQ05_2182 [Winogradskyella wandonensis]
MKQTKHILIALALVLVATSLKAQTLGEYKVNFDNFGIKPKKNAPKKVYINSFNVMVEVYREDVDYKAKREFRGKGRAEAKASAALGLKGVDTNLLQQETDKLYSEFINELKTNGFEILDAAVAKNTDYHNKSKEFNGPIVRESANPGMLEIVPTDFRGFTSEKNASGKKSNKNGLFPGMKGLGKLAKNTNMLSKQLDDAIVIDVNLALTWSKTGGSWLKGLAGANAKIETNLALGSKDVSAPKKKGLRFKGAEEYFTIPNDFTVAQGSGMKKVTWKGYLKKPIYINGVLDNVKVESENKGEIAKTYDVGNLYRVTEWNSTISSNAKFVEVNGEKFAEALYLSGKTFMDEQLEYLFEKYK